MSCYVCHGSTYAAGGNNVHNPSAGQYDTQTHAGMPVAAVISIGGASYGPMACGDCHSVELGAEHAKASSSSSATGCAACHPSPRSTLVPTWGKSCVQGGCHVPASASAMHSAVDASHVPLAANSGCTACHTLDLAALHSDASTTTASGTHSSCGVCHDDGVPVSKDCVVCHGGSPHGASSGACLTCHTVAQGSYPGAGYAAASAHAVVTASSVASVEYPGAGTSAGECENCHDGHNGTRAAGNQLCFDCHDAVGTTKPLDYSYQGSTQYAASSHNGVADTGARNDTLVSGSAGFEAWESSSQPTPSSPGATMTAAAKDALRSIDTSRATTHLANTTGGFDYQTYRFRTSTPRSAITSFTVDWRGYGETVAGNPVTLYIWNTTLNGGAGDWELAITTQMANETGVRISASPALHIDSSGNIWLMGKARKLLGATITAGPTVGGTYSSAVINWTSAGLADGWVDYGATTAYGATVGSSAMVTSHSANLPILPAGAYHYRIRSTSSDGDPMTTSDTMFGVPAPTPTPIGNLSTPGVPIDVTFSWSTPNPARAPFSYRLHVWDPYGFNQYYPTSATSMVLSLGPDLYYWQVECTDALGAVYVPSQTQAFYVTDSSAGGSCPFLFTGNGVGFAFESDNFTAARIGGPVSGGYQQPNPGDAYVVRNPVASMDGLWQFRLVEERHEVDYLDAYRLYAVDAPAGTRVFGEKPVAGQRTFPPMQSALHTVRNLRAPVSAVRTDTGADVMPAVASEDGSFETLNTDSENTFTYKTIEMDLGPDVSSAPMVKVVMDALSEFPVTPAGIARRATFGAPAKLEVQDISGSWRSVPASVSALPTPPEFSRPYVFNLTDAVAGTTGKVRFTFLFRTLIDYIAVDTSADEWLTINEVPLASASLANHGVDLEVGTCGCPLVRLRVGAPRRHVLSGQLHPVRRRLFVDRSHRRQVRGDGPGR